MGRKVQLIRKSSILQVKPKMNFANPKTAYAIMVSFRVTGVLPLIDY